MLSRPGVTFAVFNSGRCNIAGAASEREAQVCWTWFATAVLPRFARTASAGGTAHYRALSARRARGQLVTHLAPAPPPSPAPAHRPAQLTRPDDSFALDRMSGAWRGHTRACPCVGAAPNDWAYFEALRTACTAALASGDSTTSLTLLGPHVDARCTPMPCDDASLWNAVRTLKQACERQRLVVTEVVAGVSAVDAPHVWWDAVALAQMEALRGHGVVVFTVCDGAENPIS